LAIQTPSIRVQLIMPSKSTKSPKKGRSPAQSHLQKVTLKVEAVDSKFDPVVVSFPGGLPESVASNQGTQTKFHIEKLSHKSSSGRRVTGFDQHCTYTASARGLENDNRRTKLVVGIYDKKKKVVVLRQAAAQGTVFAMEQSVPSYIEKNGPVVTEKGAGLLMYNSSLFEDFGTAKKKKVLKSQAANKVDISHVVGGGAGSAVMNTVMKGEAMSESNKRAIEESKNNREGLQLRSTAVDTANDAARRNLLPPYDEHAIKPHKVYSAREIAGDAAWSRVFNKVHACMHDNDVVESLLNTMRERDRHSCCAKLIRESNLDDEARERLTCTLLLNHMISFYHMNQNRKSITAPQESQTSYFGIPIEVALRFFTLFTTNVTNPNGKSTYVMSTPNKHKLVVHVLLMYMMAQGTGMKIANLKPIADDMKTTPTACGAYLRLAACKVTKKGATLSAVLQTPVTFPPPKKATRS